MKKNILILIIFVLLFLLLTFYFLLYQLSVFTHTSISYFPSQIYQSIRQPSLSPGFNFVILGVDPRDDQLEKTQVSDSIIIGRLTAAWQVGLISIPRDLWIYTLNTKVNQIYPLSQEKISQSESFKYIEDQFSNLVGLPISKTVILTTSDLIELTKIIGGVQVNQESTYTDIQYPNPEYVKNPTSGVPIYQTVVFKKGSLYLDESNITEYVRSRKGQNEDGSGSSDIGRIQRQQKLLESLLAKLKSPEYLGNPLRLLSLYNFWHTHIQTNISDKDILSLVLSGKKQMLNIKLIKSNVPTAEYPQKDIIYHPLTFPHKQWVYIPQDKEYSQLKSFVSDFLHQ